MGRTNSVYGISTGGTRMMCSELALCPVLAQAAAALPVGGPLASCGAFVQAARQGVVLAHGSRGLPVAPHVAGALMHKRHAPDEETGAASRCLNSKHWTHTHTLRPKLGIDVFGAESGASSLYEASPCMYSGPHVLPISHTIPVAPPLVQLRKPLRSQDAQHNVSRSSCPRSRRPTSRTCNPVHAEVTSGAEAQAAREPRLPAGAGASPSNSAWWLGTVRVQASTTCLNKNESCMFGPSCPLAKSGRAKYRCQMRPNLAGRRMQLDSNMRMLWGAKQTASLQVS